MATILAGAEIGDEFSEVGFEREMLEYFVWNNIININSNMLTDN